MTVTRRVIAGHCAGVVVVADPEAGKEKEKHVFATRHVKNWLGAKMWRSPVRWCQAV